MLELHPLSILIRGHDCFQATKITNGLPIALVLMHQLFRVLNGRVSCLSSDPNKWGTTNGLSLPQPETSPVCPPTSGHQMAEKMRLGRQDQGDTDAGETLTVTVYSGNSS